MLRGQIHFNSTENKFHVSKTRIDEFRHGNKHFYFIMQTATFELYYLPKGAEKGHLPVANKSKSNTIFSP